MAGLPKKYAKMGFKKGWAAFHRAKGAVKRAVGLHGKKKSKRRGGVHHALWLNGNFSAPALVSRPVRSVSSITPKKIVSPVIDLALIVAGMAAAAMTKKYSPVKNPHIMNGTVIVGGVAGSLLTRNRFVKMPLLGVALQGTISETKILIPKMIPLAGDDEVIYLPVDESGNVPQLTNMSGDESDRMGEDTREPEYEIEGEEGRDS